MESDGNEGNAEKYEQIKKKNRKHCASGFCDYLMIRKSLPVFKALIEE